MAERRALIDGLEEDIDPIAAEEFIYQKPRKAAKPAPRLQETTVVQPVEEPPAPATPPLPPSVLAAAQIPTRPASPLTGIGRVPIGARVRIPLADAFKRASLERQLQGIQPNSVQDILEEALELWLLKHGYLNSAAS